MIKKVSARPVHATPLVYVGVTITLPVIGALVALVAEKEEMLPVPEAAKTGTPVFVQLYTMVPPVVGEVKLIVAVEPPEQMVWSGTAVTRAIGLTV